MWNGSLAECEIGQILDVHYARELPVLVSLVLRASGTAKQKK